MSDKEFSLEDNLKEIREILQQMQSGTKDFDENIKLFRIGKEKIQACQEYLDKAEMSVKKLIEGTNGPEEVDID